MINRLVGKLYVISTSTPLDSSNVSAALFNGIFYILFIFFCIFVFVFINFYMDVLVFPLLSHKEN